MSCLKRSNCFVHQGTKVGSAKKHNQYILIPQRVSQQVSALFSKQSYQILRKLGILQQISTFPSNIQAFLTSITGSLSLKVVPRRYFKHSTASLPQHLKTSPGESNPASLRKLESISPSSKLIPSRFWKLTPAEHERVLRLYLKSYFPTRI